MGVEDIEADDDGDEGGGADGDKKAGEEDGENIPDADADIFRRLKVFSLGIVMSVMSGEDSGKGNDVELRGDGDTARDGPEGYGPGLRLARSRAIFSRVVVRGDGDEGSDSYPLSPATTSEKVGEAEIGDDVGRTVPESELESSHISTALGTAARELISRGSTVAASRDMKISKFRRCKACWRSSSS